MLLQITNTCYGNCIHCLQNSTIEPKHMNMDVFKQFLKFAKNTPTQIITISGGEPTEHPNFEYIVKECSKNFAIVSIVSNGFFVINRNKYLLVKKLLNLNNVYIQITTHKNYYPKYKEVCSKRNKFTSLGNKCIISVNPDIYIHQLGRAANNSFCIKEANKHNYTTSCITAASIMYQTTFNNAIKTLESRGKFCKPLIDWKGNIHLSESWLCPSIGNVFDFNDFNKRINFKPCGRCADYQKLLDNNHPNYIYIKELMNLK